MSALHLLLKLLRIPGLSGQEHEILLFIEKYLLSLRLPGLKLRYDNAHKRIGAGEAGNLMAVLPGTMEAGRRFLSAHVDVVDLAARCKPVIKGRFIVPKGKTALGADDRTGVAAILYALTRIAKEKCPHPPLSFAFTVQEEKGLRGARFLNYGLLKKPALGFNFDGDNTNLQIGAPFCITFEADIRGIASHAGDAPEKGISAALILASAAEDLRRRGLWGALYNRSGKQAGTANIGLVNGGGATNIVMPRLRIIGEARSHSRAFLQNLAKVHKESFSRAARLFRNNAGQTGHVRYSHEWVYPGFLLSKNSACVRIAARQFAQQGYAAKKLVAFGGLDANFFNRHGIPTVTLGCGAENAHSTDERVVIPEFLAVCETAFGICTGKD